MATKTGKIKKKTLLKKAKTKQPLKKKKKTKPPRHSLIRSQLRKLWQFSSERREALKKACISKDHYKCAICCYVFTKKDVSVDHILAIGETPNSKKATPETTWDRFIERLFCPVDGLQILCKECHHDKTMLSRSIVL